MTNCIQHFPYGTPSLLATPVPNFRNRNKSITSPGLYLQEEHILCLQYYIYKRNIFCVCNTIFTRGTYFVSAILYFYEAPKWREISFLYLLFFYNAPRFWTSLRLIFETE
jgi:hypothetical protein